MRHLFKVWSADRGQRVFIHLDDSEMDDEAFYNQFIIKASEKLKENGVTVVLETDGTTVDDGTTLKMLSSEILMLLSSNEQWKPTNSSTGSTVTLNSSINRTISEYLNQEDDLNSDNSSKSEVVGGENAAALIPSSGISESSWQKFDIPLHLLNKTTVASLEKGVRTYEYINKIVNVTVDTTREVSKFPGNKAFRIIASKIVHKFPQLQDIDEDGVIIGNGYHSLFKKLVERNNYLNRPHKRPANSLLEVASPKNMRKMLNCKAGCSNWHPLDDSAESSTLEEKKLSLNTTNFQFNETTIKLLDDTYGLQRQFLNNPDIPSIQDIRTEWPVLFETEVILWHFQKLMGWSSRFRPIFEAKKSKITAFGIKNKLIDNIHVPDEDDDSQLFKCLSIIAQYFKEDINLIIVDISRNKTEDIKLILRLTAPCIVWSSNEGGIKSYSIYIEKERVVDSEDGLFIFELMFSLYYNFNMCYPKELSSTLEFVQRYFFKINPIEGTKSKKKSLNKIISLITKLRNA